jgi:hypothetical protein
VPHDRVYWLAFVNTVTNLSGSMKDGNFLTSSRTIGFGIKVSAPWSSLVVKLNN